MLLLVGCVDKNLDLDNVNPTVGIIADELVVPLGYMKDKSLEDMFGDDIENLLVDASTGGYVFSYSEDEKIFSMDGVDDSFAIPAGKYSIDVDYPSFELDYTGYIVDESFVVGATVAGQDIFHGQSVVVPSGIVVSSIKDGTIDYSLEMTLPDYIERVDKVYLKHKESQPGAPIMATLDLGSLGDVNGGGVVSLEIVVPEGCTLYDQNGKLLENNHYLIENREFAKGEHQITFIAYIDSIDNIENSADGRVVVPNVLEYHLSYRLISSGGKVLFNTPPTLNVYTDFEFEDADITLNAKNLVPQLGDISNSFKISNISDSLLSVKSITFKDTAITFDVDGLDWWSDDAIMAGAMDDIYVEVTLPEQFVFAASAGDNNYNAATRTYHATLTQLQRGFTLWLERIDFGDGIYTDENGDFTLDLSVGLCVGIQKGAKIRLSLLQHQGDVALQVGYMATKAKISSVTANIDFEYKQELVLDLKELADKGEGISITALDIDPTMDFRVTNGFSIPLYVGAVLSPIKDNVVISNRVVAIDNVKIKAAQYSGEGNSANVTPAVTHIHIGKSAQNVTADMQFVECDLERLFTGSLPHSIKGEFVVRIDPNEEVTLSTMPNYIHSYSYDFNLPLTFGSNLNLSYTDRIDGLQDTFADLDGQIDMAGDVYVICEVSNSTPLTFSFDAKLIDVNGNPSPLQIKNVSEQKIINGSKDGKTAATTTLKFKMDNSANNLFDELKKVDALEVILQVGSVADGVQLTKYQSLSANMKLQFEGGININIEDL